jgi:hypothetical protein
MKTAAVIAIVLLLLLPTAALALGEEAFGNHPMHLDPSWPDGLDKVVNLGNRFYLRTLGDTREECFYQGDAAAINEALRRFAAIKADALDVVILPGRGHTESFGRKPIDYDMRLYFPITRRRAAPKRLHPILTIYVNEAGPRPIDRKLVERWLPGLNSESFKEREHAEQELQKLGRDAKPLLRQALKSQPSAEGRKRIEAVVSRIGGVDVTDLDIPRGVTLITPEELVVQRLKDLDSNDGYIAVPAMDDLAALTHVSDKVMPALIDLARGGKSVH